MQCKDDGQTLMFSQFKQDFYLYTTHFAKLKRRGVYADVAANQYEPPLLHGEDHC